MNFIDKVKQGFAKVKEALPFVALIGHEKTYGKPSNQNYDLMIQQYKSWAYACIQRIAFAIACSEMKLYKRTMTKDGEQLDEITNHPFLDLMRNVNDFSNKNELWMLTDIFLETTGNAYWWMPKGRLGIPAVIWNLPSNWIKPIPSKTKFIDGYALKPPKAGKPIRLEEDEVVHFKYPSPFDLWHGTSPTLASAYGIDLNNQMKEWGINYFMNNAEPAGVLTSDNAIPAEASQRLRDMWNMVHRGSKKAGRIAVLGGGLKYQKIGSSLGDMAFQDTNRSIRDEILAIFGVPASILGLVEDVNRANAETNEYTFMKWTVLPRMKLIEEKMNEKILPKYDASLVMKFENPVPSDKEFRLKEQTEHIRSGYSSIDDERKKDGEEPYEVPETEAPLIPFSVTPAGSIEPTAPAQEAPEKAVTKATAKQERKWRHFVMMIDPIERFFAKTLRKYFQEQHSEVSKRLNQFRSVKAGIDDDFGSRIMFNMNEQEEKLGAVSEPYIREGYTSGVKLGIEDVGNLQFELIEPNIVRAISDRIGFFSKKVNEATVKLLEKEISVAIENGETINDVSKRVSKIFKYSMDYRSERIARTEVVGATNEGQIKAYEEAGIEMKEWLTANDEKVRDSHRHLQKKVVPLGDNFVTGKGNRLLYPSDRSTNPPADEVINCRCTVIPAKK